MKHQTRDFQRRPHFHSITTLSLIKQFVFVSKSWERQRKWREPFFTPKESHSIILGRTTPTASEIDASDSCRDSDLGHKFTWKFSWFCFLPHWDSKTADAGLTAMTSRQLTLRPSNLCATFCRSFLESLPLSLTFLMNYVMTSPSFVPNQRFDSSSAALPKLMTQFPFFAARLALIRHSQRVSSQRWSKAVKLIAGTTKKKHASQACLNPWRVPESMKYEHSRNVRRIGSAIAPNRVTKPFLSSRLVAG